MMSRSEDERWMGVALAEGRKGLGLTAPNPAVGAVLVRGGVELARGWHAKAGGPHAERDALMKLAMLECAEGDAARGARGATAYVTLEPCSSEGRTGACVVALMEAGVARVVYGSRDANPAHAGRADEILRAGGIEVESGVCEKECEDLIRGFTMVQREGRPWVIAKTAMSLDGRITRPRGEGQWLTGAEAREGVQQLRGEVDAILTSGESLRVDDPALTIRSELVSPLKEQPWRVVMSRGEVERERYQLFTDRFRDRSLVFQNVNGYDVLRTLVKEREVNTVLLEAGGDLLGWFSDEGLIDEWVIYLAPMVCGGEKVALAGEGARSLGERMSLKEVKIERVGVDVYARGLVNRGGIVKFAR